MDTISSVEFRKRYAKLTEPVIVTVMGHAIGVWTPAHGPSEFTSIEIDRGPGRVREHLSFGDEHARPTDPYRPVHVAPLHAPRPFTPVPKPSAKR